MGRNKTDFLVEVDTKELEIRQNQIEEFQKETMNYVDQGLLYIEAIYQVCLNNGIDVEYAKSMISPFLLDKLFEESCSRNLIKTSNSTLPI